jgi:hypothetical protein
VRPKREVLAVACFKHRGRGERAGLWREDFAGARSREPVVRVRPGPCLFWVFAGRLDLRGQLRELVAAALADDREWL